MGFTKEYKKKIKDKNIKRLLLNRENIEPLEYFIEKEALELTKIEHIKESLDFGRKLEKKELTDLFEEVKEEVDSFLSVSNIPIPKFRYNGIFRPGFIPLNAFCVRDIYHLAENIYNSDIGGIILNSLDLGILSMFYIYYLYSSHYNPLTKRLVLNKENMKSIIGTIAHEYTHYIQGLKFGFHPGSTSFKEGHARGVERNVARCYMEKKDDPSFIYDTSKQTLEELSNIYLGLCKKFKIKSNEHLLNLKPIKDTNPSPDLTSPYDIGNTFFYLNEKTHGPKIYNDIIHGKFKLD